MFPTTTPSNPYIPTPDPIQALRRLVKALEAEAAGLVEERADWDRMWQGRPGLLEAVEELLESGHGADVEVRVRVPVGWVGWVGGLGSGSGFRSWKKWKYAHGKMEMEREQAPACARTLWSTDPTPSTTTTTPTPQTPHNAVAPGPGAVGGPRHGALHPPALPHHAPLHARLPSRHAPCPGQPVRSASHVCGLWVVEL
jgi:hypothetical protein